MFLSRHFTSISFYLMISFIPFLNSLINALSLYLLPLTTLLNFCTNPFIILDFYSIFFNSATFIISLLLLPNYFFSLGRKSPTVGNSNTSVSKSFKTYLLDIC